MLINTGIATSLIASSLVGDTYFTSWKHYARSSFSHGRSSFWPEAMPLMSSSLRRTSITLYSQTNITSFITTTLLSARTTSDPHQGPPALSLITATTPQVTMEYTTTTVSTPSLSGCQNILISVIIDVIPPSSFVISDGIPQQDAHIYSPDLPSGHNTRSSSDESAKVQTSDAWDSSLYVTKPWNTIPASAVTEPSSPAPPYPLHLSTAFPRVRSNSAVGVLPISASKFATSAYPSLHSQNLRASVTRDSAPTLTSSFFVPQSMVSLFFTETSVSTVVQVVSLMN